MKEGKVMEKISMTVGDLAMAAYIKMHGFKCIGRKNRSFYFEVKTEDRKQFEQLKLDYINSPYHEFDSEIMSLKKIGDFISEE